MKTIWTIIRKIIRCFTLLLGISLLSFVLLKASPVDPVMASVNYDTTLSEEQYNATGVPYYPGEQRPNHPVKCFQNPHPGPHNTER